MKAATTISFGKLPKIYAELVALYPPRKIHDKVDARNTAEIMDAMAGHKLNRDQSDYFELLCDLYEEWESEQAPAAHARGHELLQLVLEARSETPADLARILRVDKSLGYRLVKGTRKLTAEQVSMLAAHYGLNPATLLPAPLKVNR
jgi:antitoxin component HigA of HigAB toxin-antitoxin module